MSTCLFLIWNWFLYMNLCFCLCKAFTCCVCIVKRNFIFTLSHKLGVSVLPKKHSRADVLLSKPTRNGCEMAGGALWVVLRSSRPRSDQSVYIMQQSVSLARQIWGKVLCRFSSCKNYCSMWLWSDVNDLIVGSCWSILELFLSPSLPLEPLCVNAEE